MTTRRVSAGATVLTATLSVIAALITLSTLSVDVPSSWGFRADSVVFAVSCGAVGAVVMNRRPDNRVGWIFTAIGVLFAIQAVAVAWTELSYLVVDGGLPGQPFVAWTLNWLWIPPLVLALAFLPLTFPTGTLASPRWRPVAWIALAGGISATVVLALAPGPLQAATYVDNPYGWPGLDAASATALEAAALTPMFVAIGLSMASLVGRFRAADDITRRQIKWFALAAGACGMVFTVYVAAYGIGGATTLSRTLEVLIVFTLVSMPVAAGIAILRYRLFEIDRIVSRTIGYAIVTGLLLAAYGVTILLVQGPLATVTGGQTIAVALSTLAVAALFQPVRRRVQRVVDRRFDRARIDADRTAAAFADRLRDEVDIGAVTADLDRTVRTTMRPTSLGLWLREGQR